MDTLLDPVASIVIALGGALLFAWAAAHKLRTHEVFAATVADYQLLPPRLIGVVAAVLIAVELAIAASLLWPATRAPGAAAGAALLVVYALAIGINLARGRRDIDCGCGLRPSAIGSRMVARNLIMAAVLCLLLLPQTHRVLGFADLATIAGTLIIGVLLYAAIEQLLGYAAPRSLFPTEH
jgi:hypothetical protein